MQKLRYRLIELLAMGDVIACNVYFGDVHRAKLYVFSDKPTSDAVISPKYNGKGAMLYNCWADFRFSEPIDPSSPLPSPVWFDEVMKGRVI